MHAQNPTIGPEVLDLMIGLFSSLDSECSDGKIYAANDGIGALLDFISENGGLARPSDFTSGDTSRFFEFCRSRYLKGWKRRYAAVRALARDVLGADWVAIPHEPNPTEGFSVAATAATLEALKLEIKRTREKIGRLESDLKTGKVLNLDLSAKRTSIQQVPELAKATGADIIKTILHYMPGFPIIRETLSRELGRCPAKWLLRILKENVNKRGGVHDAVGQHYRGISSIIDHYFPTSYDAACVLRYWAMTTGWNKEIIESVASDDVNLRFNRNRHLEAFSEDFAVMTTTVIVNGRKARGQTKDKPKTYTLVLDKTDPNGLYSVLCDYFKLTKTIRRFAGPNESRCIFICVQSTQPFLGSFGPGVFASTWTKFDLPESEATELFRRHAIYDDHDADDPQIRIDKMGWRETRTSYDTVLEDMGIPLYVRQRLLGHTRIETTALYSSERSSLRLKNEQLKLLVHSAHDDWNNHVKYFHGALLPTSEDPRAVPKSNITCLGLTNFRDNIIMLCMNCKAPTWPMHEKYVPQGKACAYISQCLFCKQCCIAKETLPYLVQWDMDITEYFEYETDWQSHVDMLELQLAIREALALWADTRDPSDVECARAEAASSAFEFIPLDIWLTSGEQ